jgi:preprotein translocase subunit SecE
VLKIKVHTMKIVEYVKDSYNELVHKVSWPTAKDLTNSSVIVLIASLVLALVVWLMDLGFENLLTWIYKLLASL